MEIFTIEKIKETSTYQELVSKKENCKVNILLTRMSRERVTNAFNVWKNRGIVPTTVRGAELSIVADLIALEKPKEIDRSFDMTAESLPCGNPNPPCCANLKYGMLECTNCDWNE